jgi:hypothetical protein
MLWYKGWLETRLKLLVTGVWMLWFLYLMHSGPPPAAKMVALVGILMTCNIAAGMVPIFLAGAGIMTQPAFQQTKGIHGSTLFTLSLPVSRLRLLTVRASLGWFLLAGLIALYCCGVWVAFPVLQTLASRAEMMEYAGTLIVGASLYYSLYVLLATFLEDMWRVFAGMFCLFGWRWVSKHTTLPAFMDTYRMMGDFSPLKTHHLPWSGIAFSIALSAVLFLVALKIVRVREY